MKPANQFPRKSGILPNRREAIGRLSAGALLAAGAWPGVLRADIFGWGGGRSFRFIEVNDLHYLDDECGHWLEGVTRQMRSHNAELCLVVGDLSDHGTAAELGPVREILQGLGIPYHVVMGNHDHLTDTDLGPYHDAFPNSVNYHFEHRGWQFIGLDTSEGRHYEKTMVVDDTLHWLDDNLRQLSKKKPTILFTHFPMGPDVNFRPINADAVLERLRDFNLQAVYGGHYHSFTERKVGGTAITTDRCCALKKPNHDGTTEKGYFLCTVKDGKVTREFIECAVPAASVKTAG